MIALEALVTGELMTCRVEFKFVERQVAASVIILTAKLKFVAESILRVYFTQHVAPTLNTVFCYETSWLQTS